MFKEHKALSFAFGPEKSIDFRASWDDIDLGMLLTLYLFQNNNATQAKIAEELGVTPMAISRRMKAKGSKIPEKWYPMFTQYICGIDTKEIQRQIDILVSMQSQIVAEESIKALISVIKRYFQAKNIWEHFELKDTPRSMGQVVFENVKDMSRWTFFPMLPGMSIVRAQDIADIFDNRVTSYKNGHPVKNGIQTILFCDGELFDKACGLWKEAHLDCGNESTAQRSLMLVNLDAEAIVREFQCE